MRFLMAAIAISNNHCVLPAGKSIGQKADCLVLALKSLGLALVNKWETVMTVRYGVETFITAEKSWST